MFYRTFSASAFASCLLAFAQPAGAGMADDKLYVTGFLGLQVGGELEAETGSVETSIDSDPGIAVGGALGYGWANVLGGRGSVRTEGEISARRGEPDVPGFDVDDNFTVLTFLGNAWYDIPLNGKAIPYVGGGLGLGRTSSDGEGETGFAWQLGGGVNVKATETLLFGFNYRFIKSNFDTNGIDAHFDGHQLTGSISIPFN